MTELIDPLLPVHVKIDRAQEHLRALDDEVKTFITSNPYEAFDSEDPITGDLVIRVKVHASPPLWWSTIIGDVFHNLRSSLDVLVYQLILANGKRPRKNSALPIYTEQIDFNKDGIKKVKGVSAEAERRIRAVKPYKTGNLRLWQLHQLNNADKHRLIIPVGSAYRSATFDFGAHANQFLPPDVDLRFPSFSLAIKPADSLFPVKDGDALFRIVKEARSQLPQPLQFRFDLAFGEGEIVQGELLIPTLHEFVALVNGIVEEFRPLLSHD